MGIILQTDGKIFQDSGADRNNAADPRIYSPQRLPPDFPSCPKAAAARLPPQSMGISTCYASLRIVEWRVSSRIGQYSWDNGLDPNTWK